MTELDLERGDLHLEPDVSGEWSIYQTGGHKIIVNISDDDGALSGSAHYEAEGESTIIDDVIGAVAPFVVIHSMEAHGTVNEAHFEFVIPWNNGARGRYTGAFQADGTLAGVAVDLERPRAPRIWGTLDDSTEIRHPPVSGTAHPDPPSSGHI